MKCFFDSIIFSYGQIFFCSKKWFGIAALLSTFFLPVIGLLGLGGAIISNATALLLKYDKEKIRKGLYGFNGILIAAAAGFFFNLTPFLIFIVFVFVIITFFISAVLENYLASSFNLPGLSLPFVISFFIFIIFLTNYNSVHYKNFSFIDYSFLSFIPAAIKMYFKSFSFILLQKSILTGIVLSVAILFFSRVMFVNSILAFAINIILLKFMFPNYTQTMLIITSFNSILVSFSLGGSLIIVSKKSIFLIVVSSMMVIIFTGFFTTLLNRIPLPVLVLPFNIIVLAIIYSLKFRQEQSDFVLLYFQPGSPEENYYYHQNRKSRFEKFKYVFPELPFFGEWIISQGFEGKFTHKDKWKYAWDFVIKNEKGNEFSTYGNTKDDFYCYNTPVAAPLEGKVVRIIDNVIDNKIGEANIDKNWGNTVIIDHGNGLFSSISHLKANTIKVKENSTLKKGELIGRCGNSGRSPSPHLHFQFQLTDKLGDKTFKHPFAHYLEKSNGKFYLKTFSYPQEGSIVKNIETHKTIKKAFEFKLGDEFEFNCILNEKSFKEKWNVEVDIYNNMYIKSDKAAVLFLYKNEKLFYSNNFIGNKKSALYYFYLNAVRIPLCYGEDIVWNDKFPNSATVNLAVRFISEFILIFGEQISSETELKFLKGGKDENNFIITSELKNRGKGIFSFYNQTGKGYLEIDKSGYIKEFTFQLDKRTFKAKIIQLPEEQ